MLTGDFDRRDIIKSYKRVVVPNEPIIVINGSNFGLYLIKKSAGTSKAGRDGPERRSTGKGKERGPLSKPIQRRPEHVRKKYI